MENRCTWQSAKRGGGGKFMKAMTKQGKQDTDMYIILLNILALKHFSL